MLTDIQQEHCGTGLSPSMASLSKEVTQTPYLLSAALDYNSEVHALQILGLSSCLFARRY